MNANTIERISRKMAELAAELATELELAELNRKNAERKAVQAGHVFERFEAMYEFFEGLPSFESDYNTAAEVNDKAAVRYQMACYEVDSIASAINHLREAAEGLESLEVAADQLGVR